MPARVRSPPSPPLPLPVMRHTTTPETSSSSSVLRKRSLTPPPRLVTHTARTGTSATPTSTPTSERPTKTQRMSKPVPIPMHVSLKTRPKTKPLMQGITFPTYDSEDMEVDTNMEMGAETMKTDTNESLTYAMPTPLVPASLPTTRIISSSSASNTSTTTTSSSSMPIIDIIPTSAHTNPNTTNANPYLSTTASPNAFLYSRTLLAMHERTQREAREERMKRAKEMADLQRARAESGRERERERQEEKVWIPSSSVGSGSSKSGTAPLKRHNTTVFDIRQQVQPNSYTSNTVDHPRAAKYTSPSVILNPRARALAQSPRGCFFTSRAPSSSSSSSSTSPTQPQIQRGRTPRSLEPTTLIAPSKIILPSIYDAEPVTRVLYGPSSSTSTPPLPPLPAYNLKTPRSPLVPVNQRHSPRPSVPLPMCARAMLRMTGAPPAGSVPRSAAVVVAGGVSRKGKNNNARRSKCVPSTYYHRLAIRISIQRTPEGRRMWRVGPRAGGAEEEYWVGSNGKWRMEVDKDVWDATRELERMVEEEEEEEEDELEMDVDDDVEMEMRELLDELEEGGCKSASLLGGERDAEGEDDEEQEPTPTPTPTSTPTPASTPIPIPRSTHTYTPRMPLSCSPPKTRAAGPVMTASWVVVSGSGSVIDASSVPLIPSHVTGLGRGRRIDNARTHTRAYTMHHEVEFGSAWEMVSSVECAA